MKLILYYCIIVCINKYRKFELMFRLDTDPTKFNGFGSNPTEVTDPGPNLIKCVGWAVYTKVPRTIRV